MLRRGEQLLAARDIIAARRFFERAAVGGNAQALCGIGKSFDPIILRKIGVVGMAGDAATAVAWYRKAADAGSTEALTRLQQLNATYPERLENRK
jgi:TPR repeat protein